MLYYIQSNPFQNNLNNPCIASKEYVLGTTGDWFTNYDYCVDNNMILATFDGDEDVEKIFDICDAAGVRTCYLGFHDFNHDNEYIFVDDGDTVDTEADGLWAPYEPKTCSGGFWWCWISKRCGIIWTYFDYTRSLGDGNCDNSRPGICEVLEVEPETICDGIFVQNFCFIFS